MTVGTPTGGKQALANLFKNAQAKGTQVPAAAATPPPAAALTSPGPAAPQPLPPSFFLQQQAPPPRAERAQDNGSGADSALSKLFAKWVFLSALWGCFAWGPTLSCSVAALLGCIQSRVLRA